MAQYGLFVLKVLGTNNPTNLACFPADIVKTLTAFLV